MPLTHGYTTDIAFLGQASADGDPGGAFLLCASLIGLPDTFSGKKSVLILSAADINDLVNIAVFDPATGKVTPSPSFKSQILNHTWFAVLNRQSLLLADGAAFNGADISAIKTEATFADDHNHNRSRVFGLRIPQTGTNWADPATLTPYVVTSGNNTWGASVQGLGTGDTPVFAGSVRFDHRRIVVTANSSNTVGRLRIIWGSPSQTDVQAIAAGQWSEEPYIRDSGSVQRGDFEFRLLQIPVGWKVWYQYWNATNLATISFLAGIHEYNL